MSKDEPDLFSWEPPLPKDEAFARATDLQTSHDAARSLEPVLPELEWLVLRTIREAKTRGKTLDEIATETGLEKVTVSPRLRPLWRKNMVIEADFKRPGRSGRQQTVWLASFN